MNPSKLALPALSMGVALVCLLPGSSTMGFSLSGEQLSLSQRDARVFNNFGDATSNDNANSDPMFPGANGLELSLWKGIIEWGSGPHGDGSGDPTQSELGSGNSNFDALWSGHADGAGGPNDNIASAITGCAAGVLAFAEGPSDDGWRIRFCDDNAFFDDGPGDIPGGRYDLQSIMAHEYGHVLGLGHSNVSGATMQSSIGSGSESPRSINSDDRSGIMAIYGARSLDKPEICQTSVNGSLITIFGNGFDDFNNTVWFTNKNTTAAALDPAVRVTGLFSSGLGTQITFAIPGAARAGDVLVQLPGSAHSRLSNPFPTDLLGSIGTRCPISIAQMIPGFVLPLDPGTNQSVTLTGAGFRGATSVVLEPGIALSSSQWSLVDDNTITLDMPQAGALGPQTLTISEGSNPAQIGFNVVPSSVPILQVGDGEPLNVIRTGESLDLIMSGSVGSTLRVYYSASALPSQHALIEFELGNGFSDLRLGPTANVGPAGTATLSMPVAFSGSPTAFYVQCVDLSAGPSPQFAVSNLQSVLLQP